MVGGVRGRGCMIALLDYYIVLLVFNMHGRGRAWQGVCDCIIGLLYCLACSIILCATFASNWSRSRT